jgi:hypothetical protein
MFFVPCVIFAYRGETFPVLVLLSSRDEGYPVLYVLVNF